MNTKLYRKDNSFIRVLAENDCNLLVMDCINKTMPKWINEPLNSFTECVEDDLRAFLGICFDDMENLNPKSKKTMYERYTIISGVITLIQDNYLRNKAIDTIAKEQNISKQTIRKYLCMYLSYMDIRALAPDDCSRKKELSSDEKNIRYALNKFFYNKNKNTLKYAYRMMLTVYFKEIKDNGKPIRLGAIAAKGSVSYNLDGFYGSAFDSSLNEQYRITWNAELYGLPTFKLLTGLVKAEVDGNKIEANFSYEQPVAGIAYRDELLTKKEKPGAVESWNYLYVNGTIKLTGFGRINGYTATSITVPNYYYDDYSKKYYKVNEIGDGAISLNSESFARLEIPYGIEKIGNGAFSGSGKSRLYYVVIPDSVKSIGTESFSHHDKLKFLFYNGKATGAPWGATNATVYPYTDEVEEFLNSNTFTASDTYASICPKASLTSVEASMR